MWMKYLAEQYSEGKWPGDHVIFTMKVTPSLGHEQKLIKQHHGIYPGQEQQNSPLRCDW